MRRSIRVLATLLVLGLLLTLLTGTVTAQKQKRKIIFVAHCMDSFIVQIAIGMKDAAAMIGWDSEFLAPSQFSIEKTVELLWSAIQAKPDAIATVMSDPTAFNEPVKKALQQGIAVIAVNTDNDFRKTLSIPFVGQSMFEAGIVAGEQAVSSAKRLTGKDTGKFIMVTCAPGHTALEARMAGMKKAIKDNSKYEVVVIDGTGDMQVFASRVEAKYLAEKEQVVGILCPGGCYEYLKPFMDAHKLKGKIAVGGFDLREGILQGIKDGYFQFTVGQGGFAQGYIPVMLAAMQVERGVTPLSYDTGAELVTPANIDSIIAREAKWKTRAKELGYRL